MKLIKNGHKDEQGDRQKDGGVLGVNDGLYEGGEDAYEDGGRDAHKD